MKRYYVLQDKSKDIRICAETGLKHWIKRNYKIIEVHNTLTIQEATQKALHPTLFQRLRRWLR